MDQEIPHAVVVDRLILVDEHVAKADDLGMFGDTFCKRRLCLAELSHCLARVLQLALDRGAQQVVIQVSLAVAALEKPQRAPQFDHGVP